MHQTTPSRRNLLKAALISAAGTTTIGGMTVGRVASRARAAVPATAPSTAPALPDRLPFSAPLTHSDWMLRPGVAWGEAGVRHMLDACKAAGWSRVLWRATDAGQATYASKLMRPASHPDADNIFSPGTDDGRSAVRRLLPNLTPAQGQDVLRKLAAMDYGAFDSLAAAVAYGHRIGLQIHAWVTVNEDDHGWGWASEFARSHPEFRWVRRDGRPYQSQLSFAFPEVRAYKLALLKELLDGYAVDGLFLDWIRTGDIRDNPQNDAAGVADYGYEMPNLKAFRAKYDRRPQDVPADDPRWAAVRAEPLTAFMRSARALCDAARPAGGTGDRSPGIDRHGAGGAGRFPIAAMVGHPWHYRGALDRIAGNLNGLLVDLPAWGRERLIDAVVAAGYHRDGGTPERAYQAVKAEAGAGVDAWTYAWVPETVADFDRDYALAGRLGAGGMLFWEADYIDARPDAARLKAAMAAKARW